MRQTSLEAYETIRSKGLLSRRRFEVYEILFHFGPLTAHEVVHIARQRYPHANQTSFNARLSELEKCGSVETVGFKVNQVSGTKNILWDVNDKLPSKLRKEPKQCCLLCGK